MRLYAKIDAVEKYGASPDTLQNLPLILERRREEERIVTMQTTEVIIA